MSSEVEDPQLVPAPVRRKWRRIAGAIVVLLVLVAGSGALVWVSTYQPLEYCCGFGVGLGTKVRAKVVDTIGLGTEYQIPHVPGGTFDLSVQIRNTGRVSVTIRDVVREAHYYWRLRDVSLGPFGPEPYGHKGTEFVAFKPVTMDPGDFLQLRLRYEFADCRTQEGFSSSFSSFRVLYSVAWAKKEAELKLPGSIALTNTGGDCGDAPFG